MSKFIVVKTYKQKRYGGYGRADKWVDALDVKEVEADTHEDAAAKAFKTGKLFVFKEDDGLRIELKRTVTATTWEEEVEDGEAQT